MKKGDCDYIAVHSVEMDEYVLGKIADISDSEQTYYVAQIQKQIDDLLDTDQREKDIKARRIEIEQLEQKIGVVVKSLRTSIAATRPYIQKDLDVMAKEIAEKKAALEKLESSAEDGKLKVKSFEQIKSLILSFKEQSK